MNASAAKAARSSDMSERYRWSRSRVDRTIGVNETTTASPGGRVRARRSPGRHRGLRLPSSDDKWKRLHPCGFAVSGHPWPWCPSRRATTEAGSRRQGRYALTLPRGVDALAQGADQVARGLGVFGPSARIPGERFGLVGARAGGVESDGDVPVGRADAAGGFEDRGGAVAWCFADADGEGDLAAQLAYAGLGEDGAGVGAQAPATVDLGDEHADDPQARVELGDVAVD